jgi:hypothetical protein
MGSIRVRQTSRTIGGSRRPEAGGDCPQICRRRTLLTAVDESAEPLATSLTGTRFGRRSPADSTEGCSNREIRRRGIRRVLISAVLVSSGLAASVPLTAHPAVVRDSELASR